MSSLIAESIKNNIPITPAIWSKEKHESGLSYGLDEAGYSIRLHPEHASSRMQLVPGVMHLAVSLEHVRIPRNVIAEVRNKSTLVRLGLWQPTTTLEPGWQGFITLELVYFGRGTFQLEPGMPIGQIIFSWLDGDAPPYEGKYQDQPAEPVTARF
jgi:dCTP deaminase